MRVVVDVLLCFVVLGMLAVGFCCLGNPREESVGAIFIVGGFLLAIGTGIYDQLAAVRERLASDRARGEPDEALTALRAIQAMLRGEIARRGQAEAPTVAPAETGWYTPPPIPQAAPARPRPSQGPPLARAQAADFAKKPAGLK